VAAGREAIVEEIEKQCSIAENGRGGARIFDVCKQTHCILLVVFKGRGGGGILYLRALYTERSLAKAGQCVLRIYLYMILYSLYAFYYIIMRLHTLLMDTCKMCRHALYRKRFCLILNLHAFLSRILMWSHAAVQSYNSPYHIVMYL